MQEVLSMDHLKRAEQRPHNTIQFLLCRCPSKAFEPRLEGLSLLKHHHHVRGRVRLEYAGDLDDARMPEACEGTRFLQEAGTTPIEGDFLFLSRWAHAQAGVALPELLRVIFFDCDFGLKVNVLGFIGNAEAARTYHALDAIAPVKKRVLRQSQATVQG